MSMVLLRVLELMVVMLRVPDSLNGYSNKRHITIVLVMVLTKAISFFGVGMRPLIGWLRLTSLLADIQIILLLLSSTFAFIRWSYLRSWQVNLTGGCSLPLLVHQIRPSQQSWSHSPVDFPNRSLRIKRFFSTMIPK